MRKFYLAPRGSLQEVQHLLSNLDLFSTLGRELGLPRLGWLFIPGKGYERLTKEYSAEFALDNGAFQLLKADFDNRLTLDILNVDRWFSVLCRSVNEGNWSWAALPDLPVHGRKFVEAQERIRRVEMSAELHHIFLERCTSSVTFRPVLQGFTPEEYLLSKRLVDRLRERYDLDEVYAVGSVCVRKPSPTNKNMAGGKARGTVEELRELLDSANAPLHFFGLHGRFVRSLRSHPNFYSSDSGAAGLVFRWEIRELKRKMGLSWEDRRKDYLLAHLVQYVRSTVGLTKEHMSAIASLF